MKLAILIVLLTFSIVRVLLVAAYAQPSPKANPTPVPYFCISKSTGAMRDALHGCHDTEIEVSLDTLLALQPSAAPTASSTPAPSATPTPAPIATATPDADGAAHLIDANGKIVGPIVDTDTPYNDDVLIIVNGLGLAIPYDANGFINDNTNLGLNETVWFTSSNCTGTPYMTLYQVGGEPDTPPLIEMTVGNTAPYVYNEIAYYAQPPFNIETFNSVESFADPTQASVNGCQSLDAPLNEPQTYLAGTIATFNLASLGFVGPFSIGD